MTDKKALTLLKKYYLPYTAEGTLSESDRADAFKSGILVPDSAMTHDEIITAIKSLSEDISLESTAKAFLYSLSSGDMRYRTALSSLVWARSLPKHEFISNNAEKAGWRTPSCSVCGCTHGLVTTERIDWNNYGVFRYFPPKQYGREPDFACAEYVLHVLREFEKLPAAEPCEEDYCILNGIFACVGQMKPHNMDIALVNEIRGKKFLDATGNAVHCILGILSLCGILESTAHRGFLHNFTNSGEIGGYRDGLSFYPLFYWRGKNGVNYDAVNEIFGSFSGDRLSPSHAVIPVKNEAKAPAKKVVSKAEPYYSDGVYTIMLTDAERRYLALDPIDPSWETESMYSVTHWLKKRTVLFYKENTIVKVIHEVHSIDDDGAYCWRDYSEFDTRLETDNRKMLLPLTARGRAKPITPTNVMAVKPFGCTFNIYLKKEESQIAVQNLRNNQIIPIGEEERVKKIMSDEDFHEFMRYYISTCPDDYFEHISAVRNMKHQTVKFRAGDIFRCQIDRTHCAYGLILGKTREIETWKELPKEHSFRHVMTQPILVRMYDFVTTDQEMSAALLSDKTLCPPRLCSDCDILWGTHKIVAHKKLVPDDIQFQLQLARQVKKDEHFTPFTAEGFMEMSPSRPNPESLYVEWGFASFEIPWADVPDNIRRLLDKGRYFDGGVAMFINADTPKHIRQDNLLLLENRDKFGAVMEFLGLSPKCTVDDFAAKYGGISRQKYIELIEERGK